jgi:nucleotide-binding universal stress UspA family protein
LHDLHRQDVIHLDIKPSSIIFRASGEAVLIDFGLARHGHYPDLLEEEFRTPIGNWVYLAPEQIVGVRCDPRSDIFALGAILYHLATGRFPFGKPSRMAELRRRLYRDPLPPRALGAETPGWLQEIILHCLEVDARDRYASAAAVAFDLANPAQVAITERGLRDRRTGAATLFRRWLEARKFEPAPCPPVAVPTQPAPIVLVAIAPGPPDESAFAALRDAARRVTEVDHACRVACVTVVPPAAGLSGERYEETPTGRHIAQLVNLRRFARPLELPEERLTYHVLESDKPAAALIDYAKMNEVDQILLGAPRSGRPMRLLTGVAAQVVAEAQCTVSVVRPRPQQ